MAIYPPPPFPDDCGYPSPSPYTFSSYPVPPSGFFSAQAYGAPPAFPYATSYPYPHRAAAYEPPPGYFPAPAYGATPLPTRVDPNQPPPAAPPPGFFPAPPYGPSTFPSAATASASTMQPDPAPLLDPHSRHTPVLRSPRSTSSDFSSSEYVFHGPASRMQPDRAPVALSDHTLLLKLQDSKVDAVQRHATDLFLDRLPSSSSTATRDSTATLGRPLLDCLHADIFNRTPEVTSSGAAASVCSGYSASSSSTAPTPFYGFTSSSGSTTMSTTSPRSSSTSRMYHNTATTFVAPQLFGEIPTHVDQNQLPPAPMDSNTGIGYQDHPALSAFTVAEHGTHEVCNQRSVPGYTHQVFGEMPTPNTGYETHVISSGFETCGYGYSNQIPSPCVQEGTERHYYALPDDCLTKSEQKSNFGTVKQSICDMLAQIQAQLQTMLKRCETKQPVEANTAGPAPVLCSKSNNTTDSESLVHDLQPPTAVVQDNPNGLKEMLVSDVSQDGKQETEQLLQRCSKAPETTQTTTCLTYISDVQDFTLELQQKGEFNHTV